MQINEMRVLRTCGGKLHPTPFLWASVVRVAVPAIGAISRRVKKPTERDQFEAGLEIAELAARKDCLN
jgi:hypothetical protein